MHRSAAPPRLPLFAEDADESVRRALALTLSVCSALGVHHSTRYGALALLAGALLCRASCAPCVLVLFRR